MLELLDENGFYALGQEAAQASIDAHGEKVPADEAWDFAVENLIDEENEAAYTQCQAMRWAPLSFVAGYYAVSDYALPG